MFTMKKAIKIALMYIVVAVILFATLFPIYWMVETSLKEPVETFRIPPKWIFTPTLENYYQVLFVSIPFTRYLLNSVFTATVSTLLALLLGIPCAYSLARFRVGGPHLPSWILSTRFLPPFVVVIPFFLMFRDLGLLDTRFALILPYLTIQLPFVVWFMRAFIKELPADVEEAAMIDGCSRVEALRRIVLPLMKPAIAASAVFCVIFSWNEFLYALILTGMDAKTLPVATLSFITERGIMWGELTAAGTMTVLPVIVFAFIVQKHMVRGLTYGMLKG